MAAIEGNLDLLGLMVLAFSTALVGGIIRDLLIGSIPPGSIRDWRYPAVAFLGGAVVFCLHQFVSEIPAMVLIVFDAAGLGLFAVAGAVKALDFGIHPFMAVLMGGVTGVGGGTVRDILLARVPSVLRADVYATAALAGAAVRRRPAAQSKCPTHDHPRRRGLLYVARRQRLAPLEPTPSAAALSRTERSGKDFPSEEGPVSLLDFVPRQSHNRKVPFVGPIRDAARSRESRRQPLPEPVNRTRRETCMRIVGFFLGLLLLNSSVAVAQVTLQPTASVARAAGATEQTQTNVQETSSSKNEKDQSGSDGGHRLHLRLGTIALGAGYSHFSGPAYYPYAAYPFYPPGWEFSALWFPYSGPYPFFAPGYFSYGSAKGEVKLAAEPKTAEVFLDRAYAGTADHLKNIWLEPGAYDLSLAANGREDFHQRIYVLSGKSLKITAKLLATELKPADAAGQIPDK